MKTIIIKCMRVVFVCVCLCLPFSDVNCFSGSRSMAACKTAGSDLPFELNAYIDKMYTLPACKFDTANLANGDE